MTAITTVFEKIYTQDQILTDLVPVFERLLEENKKKVFLFQGTLGAGKTTLIRTLLYQLFDIDKVQSPTFTYLNQYKTATGLAVSHFDLYRLSSVDEFFAFGFDEQILKKSDITFIEWPEIVFDFFAKPTLSVSIYLVKIEHCLQDGVNPDLRKIQILKA